MKILSLDPSSTCCGWAVLTGEKPNLSGFGVLKAPSSAKSLSRIDWLAGGVAGLNGLVREERPDVVVMEWTSGKVHGRIGRASGLAVLGQAQGAIRQAVRGLGVRVETVSENEWTGSVPKSTRARRVALEFASYRDFAGDWLHGGKCLENDKGLDVADAIGLGVWWLRRHQYAALAAKTGGGR